MKPISPLTAKQRLYRGEGPPVGRRLKHPVMDFHFHAPSGDLRAANDRIQRRPSFRDLSSDFLATENRRDYVAEAFFFVIIVGISAWPIGSMFHALMHLS